MARKKQPNPDQGDPATAWARDVVSGRIVAGHLMKLSCERHLRDIKDGPKRGLHWRPEKAETALAFFPAVLSVTAGEMEGQPFHLPSYTTFVIGSLFGWCQTNGRMRYRHAWIEAGKGSIKSPLMAAAGIYMMGFRGIARAEVYAIAKDRNQANVLFHDAVAMVQAPIPDRDGETLEGLGQVLVRGNGLLSYAIEHQASGSTFRALAGDERVNGPRPTMVLADEIHEWKSGAAIETWQAGIAKMPGDALMMMGTNTPAEDQTIGTEYSENYQRILRGEARDDTAFAVIARTDPGDDPMHDESCWLKSMPVLGITFPYENVRGEVAAAEHRIAKSMSVKRLYFGIPTGNSEYWIDLDAWQSVQGRVEPRTMTGARCWLSLDLSRKNDLTALGIGWLDDRDQMRATVKYWKPRDGLADAQRSDGGQYLEWAERGQDGRAPVLTAVPGRTIDYEFVAAEVQRWCSEHDVQCMAVDPAFLSDFLKACESIGFDAWIWSPENEYGTGLKIIIHGQGAQGMTSPKMLWMPRSLGQLEDMILNRQAVIDENPLTKWCAGNAAVQPDARGNRYLVKRQQRGRIDGLVVLAMLAGLVSAEIGKGASGSIYDDPDAYARTLGRTLEPAAAARDDSIEWDPDVLRDMRHPAFAEHKSRFERWQDMQGDE